MKNKSPPIYPSPYQCLDTVRLWNGEDNPMIVNCCAEPSLDNISPSWIAPLCVCTYQARHQFPPCAVSWPPSPDDDLGPPVSTRAQGAGSWDTRHHQLKWVMRLLAQLTAANILLMDSDSKCIFMTTLSPRDRVSRDCHAGVSCHYIVTSSLGQRPHYHYPCDKITLSSGLRCIKFRCSNGKLFFRIDSMCNSVKCATPCFMEWCHAVTNLSNSPVCSMSKTHGSANFI